MEEVIRKYFQCWLDKDGDAIKEIFGGDIIYSEGNVDRFDGVTIAEFDADMKICDLKEFQAKAKH